MFVVECLETLPRGPLIIYYSSLGNLEQQLSFSSQYQNTNVSSMSGEKMFHIKRIYLGGHLLKSHELSDRSGTDSTRGSLMPILLWFK